MGFVHEICVRRLIASERYPSFTAAQRNKITIFLAYTIPTKNWIQNSLYNIHGTYIAFASNFEFSVCTCTHNHDVPNKNLQPHIHTHTFIIIGHIVVAAKCLCTCTLFIIRSTSLFHKIHVFSSFFSKMYAENLEKWL